MTVGEDLPHLIKIHTQLGCSCHDFKNERYVLLTRYLTAGAGASVRLTHRFGTFDEALEYVYTPKSGILDRQAKTFLKRVGLRRPVNLYRVFSLADLTGIRS